jgi:hypothetical protein
MSSHFDSTSLPLYFLPENILQRTQHFLVASKCLTAPVILLFLTPKNTTTFRQDVLVARLLQLPDIAGNICHVSCYAYRSLSAF